MKSLKKNNSNYNLARDVRHEQMQFGKYLYLVVITIFFMVIINLLFGHYYILKGEGMVYANNSVHELEVTATIDKVYVHEGERVSQNQPLFLYSSLELQDRLSDLLMKSNIITNQISKNNASKIHVQKNIETAKVYSNYSKDLLDKLQGLSEDGMVNVMHISPEAKRNFDAEQSLLSSQKELEQLQLTAKSLKNQQQEMQSQYQAIINYYSHGLVSSSVNGIVAQLDVVPGDVLKQGTPAARVFYGERYVLSYFNQNSWVNYKVGDSVIVHLPGYGYKVGKITALLPISNRLPEEFQPKFKEQLRYQVAKIQLSPEVLKQIPILSTVNIYKPLGFELFYRLFFFSKEELSHEHG